MLEKEKLSFEITDTAKKKVIIFVAVGLFLLLFGILGLSQKWSVFDPASAPHDAHHDVHATEESTHDVAHHDHHPAEADAHGEIHHDNAGHADGHEFSFWKRIKVSLWHNNIFFFGISIIGVFLLCVMRAFWGGWYVSFIRVLESFGYYLPVAAVVTLVVFVFAGHDIFHWLHHDLYDVNSPEYDPIIDGKGVYFFAPLDNGSFPLFFYLRLLVFFGGWIFIFFKIRKLSLQEDLNGGDAYYKKMLRYSAGFLVFFAVSSSMSAWDWILSIDTHWFSTMFGWYVFASMMVTGISAVAFTVVKLKEAGYLKLVNSEHLHDLGKLMFAFSIFWTYIWFSQFILYWYANIPEEIVWFADRLLYNEGRYAPIFFLNLLINFFFPFLFLMTRNAKRQSILIKVAACGIMIGHWLDFYLMMYPGVIQEHGGLNLGSLFVELGIFLMFLGVFIMAIMKGLSKAPMIAKNHPMLEESINHHT